MTVDGDRRHANSFVVGVPASDDVALVRNDERQQFIRNSAALTPKGEFCNDACMDGRL
ncbi:hypothetical protein ACIBCT_18765 [Streptosporangium sp. NPDC050855]|uniref:hypothetical protein n=1 Tax=Streptosporangium sp. NPDC050855 TaxID=3366194 RepID=UPI003796A8AE